MKLIIALIAALTLMGCAATSGLSPEGEAAYFEAQKSAAYQPLFEMTCPETGCNFSTLRVNNPNSDGVQALHTSNPGLEFGREVLRTVVGIAPWVGVTKIAVEGIRGAQGVTTTTTTNTHTDTRGDTYGDSATVVGGDQIPGRVSSPDDYSSVINQDDNSVTYPPAPEPEIEP